MEDFSLDVDYTTMMDTASSSGNGWALAVFWIVYFAVLIFLVISQWKVYEKAQKPGWAVLVPVYNVIVYLQIINKPWWWIFLMLIPLVNIVFIIWMTHRLSLSFGKSVGFTIGLLVLPFIFFPILAFSDAQYRKLAE